MREHGEERCQRVGGVDAGGGSRIGTLELHLMPELPPDLFQGQAVVGVQEPVETDHMELGRVRLRDLGQGRLHKRGFSYAPVADDEHRVALAGGHGSLHERADLVVFGLEANEGCKGTTAEAEQDFFAEGSKSFSIGWFLEDVDEFVKGWVGRLLV